MISLDPATSLTFYLLYDRKFFGTDSIIIHQSSPAKLQEKVSQIAVSGQPTVSGPPAVSGQSATFYARSHNKLRAKTTLHPDEGATSELASATWSTHRRWPFKISLPGKLTVPLQNTWIYRPPGSDPSALSIQVEGAQRGDGRNRELLDGYAAARVLVLSDGSQARWEPVSPHVSKGDSNGDDCADEVVMRCFRVKASPATTMTTGWMLESKSNAMADQAHVQLIGEGFLQHRKVRLDVSMDPKSVDGMLILMGFLALYERAYRIGKISEDNATAFTFDEPDPDEYQFSR